MVTAVFRRGYLLNFIRRTNVRKGHKEGIDVERTNSNHASVNLGHSLGSLLCARSALAGITSENDANKKFVVTMA